MISDTVYHKDFRQSSNPKNFQSEDPVLVISNADIAKMFAYDHHGCYKGRPQCGQHYAKIEKFCGGKLVSIINGGYITPSDSPKPYEYDVYSCAPNRLPKPSRVSARHLSAV